MASKTQKKIIRTFPLLEKLQKADALQLDNRNNYQVPDYIKENLNQKLRTYQHEAIRYFHYSQEMPMADDLANQLLFHMATGAGKTMVMAALILYLYKEKNYQNFLFLVNTKGVVQKTKDNLLNTNSPKYLFTESLEIEGERIFFVEKSQFPKHPEKNMIYIRIDTIQAVASELNDVRENGLTYDDFTEMPVVILGDEAHHFNAFTKKNLSTEEKKNKNWEQTIDRIRQQRPDNRQLEFTATIDVDTDSIYEKYKDKIVYRYALDQFIQDGYSKKVYRLQANDSDDGKMLNAVLLSQFRKYIARENQISDFKPIILFKSSKIAISNATNDRFHTLINELTVESLQDFLQSQQGTSSQSLRKTYEFYEKQDLAAVLAELKRDFRRENIINVNDNTSSGMLDDAANFSKLNTLEESDNPFRVIFAVAKLSEGWDVLNLYDIVRISEQAGISTAATNSEAQLIGRGARYNPFEIDGEKSYTRRYDDRNTPLTFLESLHYHTINEPAYLKNLKKSLDEMQLRVENDDNTTLLEAKVKDGFKSTTVYKQGEFFFNETEEVPLEVYDSLKAYGMRVEDAWYYDFNQATFEQALGDYTYDEKYDTIHLKLEKRLFKKAIQRNSFYHFNHLRDYLPNIRSINEFLTSENWLKRATIIVRVAEGKTEKDLTPQMKLEIVSKYLSYVQKQIKINFNKKRGTNRFIGYPIKEVVKDYTKITTDNFSGVLQDEKKEQIIRQYPMDGKPWFVFDKAVVNGLEKEMIDWIGSYIQPLNQKYTRIYLIRIDERNTNLSLHAFTEDSKGRYSGFIPDFLLYLEGEAFVYQIFMEPKGRFAEQDQWKEDLLLSLNTESIELFGENDKIRLLGVKFFTAGDGRNVLQQLSELVYDGNNLNEMYEL